MRNGWQKKREWEKPVLDLIRAWVSSSEPEKAVLGERLSEVIRQSFWGE